MLKQPELKAKPLALLQQMPMMPTNQHQLTQCLQRPRTVSQALPYTSVHLFVLHLNCCFGIWSCQPGCSSQLLGHEQAALWARTIMLRQSALDCLGSWQRTLPLT